MVDLRTTLTNLFEYSQQKFDKLRNRRISFSEDYERVEGETKIRGKEQKSDKVYSNSSNKDIIATSKMPGLEEDLVKGPKLTGKLGKHEEKLCFNIHLPLEKVVKGICIFDTIRSIWDTALVVIMFTLVTSLEYEDVTVPSGKWKAFGTKQGGPNVVQEKDILFHNSKSVLVSILIGGIVTFVLELPLAVFLYFCVKNKNRSRLRRWMQMSGLLIILNIIFAVSYTSYAAKVGVIRNDLFSTNENLFHVIAFDGLVFRIIIFDFLKGMEIILVNGFINENKRRVTWGRMSSDSNKSQL